MCEAERRMRENSSLFALNWVIVPFLEDAKARVEYRAYSTLAIIRLRCLLDVQVD